MTRPQIVVSVAAALQRRGIPTDTGTAFMVYAGATGSTDVVSCETAAQIEASAAPDAVKGYVRTALNQGAPLVHLLRAVAVDAAAVTEAEWKTALGKLDRALGPGQVMIPGVSTSAAHAALLDHSSKTGRVGLLDTAVNAAAATVVSTATALAAAAGANRSTLLVGWSTLPAPANTTVDVPPSVITAGLIGRGDAATGHANNAAAGDQSRGAGFVLGATGVKPAVTDAEHDSLHDKGVSVFRVHAGQPQLYGFVSLSTDPNYRQLNHGRITMQLTSDLSSKAEQFLFRQIDGRGLLYSELEGMLRGYLTTLWAAGALFGETEDDAFDVDVTTVNTPATAAAGELNADVEVRLSSHAEKVRIRVTTNTAAEEI